MGILNNPVNKPQDIYTEQSISYVSSPDRKEFIRLQSLNDEPYKNRLAAMGAGGEEYALKRDIMQKMGQNDGKMSETQKIDRNM